jgi:hypothetical protein
MKSMLGRGDITGRGSTRPGGQGMTKRKSLDRLRGLLSCCAVFWVAEGHAAREAENQDTAFIQIEGLEYQSADEYKRDHGNHTCICIIRHIS